jgi:protein TonB
MYSEPPRSMNSRAGDARRWLVPASITLHLAVMAILIHHRSAYIAPVRLPGTAQGSHLVLTYAPGRSPAQQDPIIRKKPLVAKTRPPVVNQEVAPPVEQAAAMPTPAPAANQPDTNPGNDALGTGDVNIALLAVFPTPKPDLSQLPRGTKGDVVLDVTIDETGKVVQLTMARGVGHGVDESVIATVHQWLFHPATRNGKPVASEQELLFHYERS